MDIEAIALMHRPRTKRYPNAVIAKGIELWRNGMNQTEICRKLGVNHVTVNRWITDNWFGFRGDFGLVEVRQSAINPPPVIVPILPIVKLKRKPKYWTKAIPKPMPDFIHNDYKLKRKMSYTFHGIY